MMNSQTQARQPTHIPGEPGLWVFILGDMFMFGVLFCVFLYYRSDDVALFTESQQRLRVTFGAVNTLVLLISSWFVARAVHAVRCDQGDLARKLLKAGIVCGLLFVVLKIFEYGDKISHGLTFFSNEFFKYYFILTGLHLLHLCVGVLVLLILRARIADAAKPSTDLVICEAGGVYWHLVDLLWIVIFPLLYLLK
jgi:nitric oxide reductase NorE protein